MKLYDLKVNHLTNPLGFWMERTVFSWKVRESSGKFQKAARIVVGRDPNLQDVVCDSGFREDLSSTGAKLPVPLVPCTRYYWTVTVQSDAGEEVTGPVQWFETAKMDQPWVGQWITCDSEEKRHPYLETTIPINKTVTEARLYICGLGLYEAYLDDRRIGDEYLTPYSNNYKEWLQYQTYDITEELKENGGHRFSVLLGNGWYKSRFGFAAFEDKGYYGKDWKLIAEIRLRYEDGSEEVIGTDDSWTVRRSWITFSNLYDGEHMDTTLPEMPTEKTFLCTEEQIPEAELCARRSLPVTIHECFEPVECIHTPAGEYVYDMGQEFTGIFELPVCEPEGTVIHIQTGEILQNGNFYNENLRAAKSEYFFVTDGTPQIIVPHFTFFGYRYVKIEGLSNPEEAWLRGLALYSDLEPVGTVTTGHKKVNRLIENVRWGLKSNFLDVPTDCPQRDERMGWTGDAQVFSPTALYLTDAYAFYGKYLHDMETEQKEHDGMVPDVIPSAGISSCATVWGDAACIIPWNVYVYSGDPSILEDQYESMKAWVDYVLRYDGENHRWRKKFHYGDWLALDHPAQDAEQVMGATDEAYIAEIYLAQSAGLVAKAAAVLGLSEDQEYYDAVSSERYREVREEYITPSGRCAVNTQTGVILALRHHLSDNTDLLRAQLRHLFEDTKGKLRTGFVGTPLLCNVLSENGMDDLAYDLLLNEEFPGWLREVNLGATTVWERWNSLLDDGTISGISMNSMNHYAYGSILEWIFSHAAGIQLSEEAPGAAAVVMEPKLHNALGRVDATYDSAAGAYEMHWEIVKAGCPEGDSVDSSAMKVDSETDSPAVNRIHIRVTVPFGGRALLKLPLAGPALFANPYHRSNPMFENVKNGICFLTAGTYEICYEPEAPIPPVYDLDTPLWKMEKIPELKAILEKTSFFAMPEALRAYSMRTLSEKYPEQMSEEELLMLGEKIRTVTAGNLQ